MQEDDVAVPLLDAHGRVRQPHELFGENRQLVEMGREEPAAAIDLVQMLDRRPGDRQAVEGRGAAADLVEDHQRAVRRLIEDRRRLDHLDHEGRPPAGEIVRSADAREEPVDHADMRGGRGHEGSRLGHDRDQRVLAQEGRLAAHVGPGEEPDRAALLAVRRRKIAAVGDEGIGSLAPQGLLHDGVASSVDREHSRAVDRRARIILLLRKHCEPGRDVDRRERQRCRLDRLGLGDHLAHHGLEGLELDRQRPVRGIGDLRFELGKLGRGEAHGIRHGLAMNEAGAAGVGVGHRSGIAGGHLDEVAEHVVVLDLQRLDARLFAILQLQPRDHAARLIAQRPHLVELGARALADEAAVALQKRQFLGKGRVEAREQFPRQGRDRVARFGQFRRELGAREERRYRRRGPHARLDGTEIARAAAAEREPRQGPRHVRRPAKRVANIRRKARLIGQHLDRIEPLVDPLRVGQGRHQPFGEQPGAPARHRAIERLEQAAVAGAGKRLGEFQIGAGRRIDEECRGGAFPFRNAERRALLELGLLDIGDRRRSGRELRAREAAEPIERAHAVVA